GSGMGRLLLTSVVLGLSLAGCDAQAPKDAATPSAPRIGGTDALLAGQTLTCNTGGPSSRLTFAVDGTLSGELLQSQVTGSWYAIGQREVHAHVQAGPVSLRDDLKLIGARWVGKTTSCRTG
ncbi:MAG: hypothetical protein AAF439_07950, partial [Pseudomonadota bacterium]